LSTDESETFTNNAVGKKPFACFDARATRDASTGDITITWQRRSRKSVRTIGALGISIPLGEDSESYDIDVMAAGSPTTVLLELTSTTTSVTFTAAQQSTCYGSPQPSTFRVNIYQNSEAVGRSYVYEATLPL